MGAMSEVLFGLTALPTAALVWSTAGPLVAVVLTAGLVLSATALALVREGASRSLTASPPRGGHFLGYDRPLRAAA
jgi:hypothetical protein